MNKTGSTGLRRILNATVFSMDGLKAAWRNEAAFRQECALVALLLPAAFWLGDGALERATLIAPCGLVLIVELLNSAVEAAVDRIGPERHELSGRAKDFGSAGVLISLALLAVIWALFLWERFFGS